MKKEKIIEIAKCTIMISIIIAPFIILAINLVPIIVYENARNWYGDIAEEMFREAFTDLSHMDYDALSNEYKSKISREYFDSVKEDDLYDFYSFVNSIEPKQGILAALFGARPPSTKKSTVGFIEIEDIKYVVFYEFIVRPSLLTLEPVVEKWTIKMQIYEKGFNIYEGEYFYP